MFVLRFRSMLLSASVLVFLAAPALGQSGTMQVDIPFDFHVDGQFMNAGSYSFYASPTNSLVRISGSRARMVVLSTPASDNRSEREPRLLFTRYGSLWFLSELRCAGINVGRALPKSNLEIESEKAGGKKGGAVLRAK